MRIGERYPHLNGWEYLQVHRRNLWRDVEDVIQDIDAETRRTKESKTADCPMLIFPIRPGPASRPRAIDYSLSPI